ncbi:MAG: hypothetical protein WCN92_05185, partial [Eubacteriales bacterium]
MKKIVSLFMALVLVGLMLVPASAAPKQEKAVRIYFEMPVGMTSIPFAGLPDLTRLTLVLTDDAGFTKRFLLPDQSDLYYFVFSDAEGTGDLEVFVYEPDYISVWAQYETKNEKYVANYLSFSSYPSSSGASSFMWNGESAWTSEMLTPTQTVTISQKQEAKGFVFKAPVWGWYSFNITGDTTGHPYIELARGKPLGAPNFHALDFTCSYAHSISVQLNAMETFIVAASTLGGHYTGSFDITAAPAVLSVAKETIKVRYHGIVPWSEILENTTYEPKDLRIDLGDGGASTIVGDGWSAHQRGEYPVTILAPSDTDVEAICLPKGRKVGSP